MLFNSIEFLIFFPIVTVAFFIIPPKLRHVWLLISSYYFYMSWNPRYALLIAFSTVITYISSVLIERYQSDQNIVAAKCCVFGSLLINLGILGIFKYANFFLENLSRALERLGFGVIEHRLDLLLPVGISFYTFQALSYTLDVYRGEIKAERNILKYALFVSFFPQLVAGPIERSKGLFRQVQNVDRIKVWDFNRVRDGLLLMIWGLFQKLVIADRAALLVNTVIGDYRSYGFLEITIAAVLFAFQIYCDFGGYSNIARGAAQVMGFHLMQNFRQPYLAVDIKDFWRRWHISLTSWFTDYLYIPLGGNRKGTVRKWLNILLVFVVSGMWHGASWNFIVWGLIHAEFQIVGDVKHRIAEKFKCFKVQASWSSRLRKTLLTFMIVDFAWIFFLSNSLKNALWTIQQMFTSFQTTSIYQLGLSAGNWCLLLFGIGLLLVVDVLHERGVSVFAVVNRQEFWFRWILYLGLVWTVIMFGIYGVDYDTSTFIYFQF